MSTTIQLSLRDYQELAISQTYQYFESGLASILMYAPTGAGKTVIAAKIIADYVQAGKRVLFIVHRGKLVRQTLDKLSKYFGIEAGVIWGDYYKPDYSKPVQIAMLQTIVNRDLPPDIDLVILDEAHTGSYFKVWRNIMDKYSGGIWVLSKTKFLGLSASPWRSKNDQGYCQFFQTIVQTPYPNQLIEMGHLCRARQFGFTNLIDESKLKVVDGEYTEKSMADVCTPALNSEIVKLYLEKDPNLKRKLIAFCATVKQAKDLAYQFYLVGVIAQCIVGETPEKEREDIFTNFSSGQIQLISSVGVLCEGFDEPTVTSVLVCRPIKSRALWVQMSGRGLRTSDGKDDCWFFDFCGNIKRLGMPTDSKKLKLCPTNKAQPEEDIIPTKECPQCHSMVAKYEKYCPHCGYMFPGKKSLASDEKRKFEEVLSPEQKRQVRFIKTKAVNAYNERRIIDIESEFATKFNYHMPEEWYDGLIFNSNDDTWLASLQHYWRYLLLVNIDPNSIETRTQIDKCIKREFKSQIENAAKNFAFSLESTAFQSHEIDGKVTEEIKRLIGYKSWWVILGQERPIAAENIFTTYMVIRNTRLPQLQDKPLEIMAYGELLDMAVSEGIEYYAIDQPTINEHIRAIKDGIKFKRFTLLHQYIKNLTPTEKERVWSELSSTEKLSYRSWKETNANESIKQHTIKLPEEETTPYIEAIPVSTPRIKPKPKPAPTPINNIPSTEIATVTRNNVTTTIDKSVDTSKKNLKAPSIGEGIQLTLFTETESEKHLNDVVNPMRLRIGDTVANNNPNNKTYNQKGQITKTHIDKRLCQVYYAATNKYSWCRYVDLRRI